MQESKRDMLLTPAAVLAPASFVGNGKSQANPRKAPGKGMDAEEEERLRQPKRLRGWQLQKEILDPCQKEEASQESALANKLVQLWAQGLLSAKLAAELASLALLDGATGTELVDLAKVGGWGSSRANCQRELVQRFSKQMKLQQAFAVKVEAVHPRTSVCTMADAACFLPHVMFSSLGTGYPEQFQQMFGISGAEAFWKGVEKQNDPRLLNHPMQGTAKSLRKGQRSLFLCMGMEWNSKQEIFPCAGAGVGCSVHCQVCRATCFWLAGPRVPPAARHGSLWMS